MSTYFLPLPPKRYIQHHNIGEFSWLFIYSLFLTKISLHPHSLLHNFERELYVLLSDLGITPKEKLTNSIINLP